MPSNNNPESIVARWLHQNNYSITLKSFLAEAGLPPTSITTTSVSTGEELTLELLLEEKRLYDHSLSYEKRSEPSPQQTWRIPAPGVPYALPLTGATNVLSVGVDRVNYAEGWEEWLAITMADRRLIRTGVRSVAVGDDNRVGDEVTEVVCTQDSPILSWTALGCGDGEGGSKWFAGTTMSGKVFIQTHDGSTQAVERMDHKRYCVKAAVSSSNPSEWLLATIGWDSRLNIYRIPKPQPGGIQELDPPVSTLTLQSIPEDIIWLPNPNPVKNDDDKNGNEDEILLLSRRDSSLLYYYAPTSPEPTLLGTQNLAPHALSRSILTPSSISLCPTDPTLLAAAIPSLPHLKLIITRLLVPLSRQTNEINRQSDLETAKREESAILQHISTLAPQTPYSTPKVVWRPDGSGVWVNGDDGCIRGIEVSTGKIVASLTGGHEGGVKVRTLWAGYVGSGKEEERSREEWVISGGFDRKVVVWRVGEVL